MDLEVHSGQRYIQHVHTAACFLFFPWAIMLSVKVIRKLFFFSHHSHITSHCVAQKMQWTVQFVVIVTTTGCNPCTFLLMKTRILITQILHALLARVGGGGDPVCPVTQVTNVPCGNHCNARGISKTYRGGKFVITTLMTKVQHVGRKTNKNRRGKQCYVWIIFRSNIQNPIPTYTSENKKMRPRPVCELWYAVFSRE